MNRQLRLAIAGLKLFEIVWSVIGLSLRKLLQQYGICIYWLEIFMRNCLPKYRQVVPVDIQR